MDAPLDDVPIDAKPIEISLPVSKLIDGKPRFEHASAPVDLLAGDRVVTALADTLDPADIADLVVCEASDDGGKTWRELARVTGARAAPPPWDPTGPLCKPGVIVTLSGVAAKCLTRTRVIHTKPVVATVSEMSRAEFKSKVRAEARIV